MYDFFLSTTLSAHSLTNKTAEDEVLISTNKATMANINNDLPPQKKWFKRQGLGQLTWDAGTNHALTNPAHDFYIGCSPLESATGLNERRCKAFGLPAEDFSILVNQFAELVDGYPDTAEGKKQQRYGREALKLKLRHCYSECKTRLNALYSLTTTTTRVVSVLGVQHTFSFDTSMDKIYNAVVQYYDANRNIEAFDGITKEQGLVKLLSLPGDQFNEVFDGRFDINSEGFIASKNCVKEYATKLMEHEMEVSAAATTAATPATEPSQFQMMVMELSKATNSNINALARTSATNVDALASSLDAERVERIAGQVQHKALIERNTIGIGKAHERIDGHAQRIDNLERAVEALTPKKKDPTPVPTPTPRKKRVQAPPVSVRRSARKKPALKYGA